MNKLTLSFFLIIQCFVCYAANTVTAVTKDHGSMTTVSIQTPPTTYRYSTCINLTPYTYTWNINDIANISVNSGNTAWTLNDLNTAAIALCIVRVAI